jgi:hypothetical protein
MKSKGVGDFQRKGESLQRQRGERQRKGGNETIPYHLGAEHH